MYPPYKETIKSSCNKTIDGIISSYNTEYSVNRECMKAFPDYIFLILVKTKCLIKLIL